MSEGTVRISVRDTDPTLPAVCPADPGRDGQHGLEIVMAACQSFEVRREPVGKRARAAIVLTDDPGGDPAAACCDRPWAPEPAAGVYRPAR